MIIWQRSFLLTLKIKKFAPENRHSQKETSLPNIFFQGRAVKFRGCNYDDFLVYLLRGYEDVAQEAALSGLRVLQDVYSPTVQLESCTRHAISPWLETGLTLLRRSYLGSGNAKVFYFYPENWRSDPIRPDNIF